jgi:hypothetical protein
MTMKISEYKMQLARESVDNRKMSNFVIRNLHQLVEELRIRAKQNEIEGNKGPTLFGDKDDLKYLGINGRETLQYFLKNNL